MTSWIRTSLCLVVALLALAAPRGVRAEKRIVVLDIPGAPSNELRDELVAILRVKYRVIAGAVYEDAARNLGAAESIDPNVAKVAAAIGADGVLESAFFEVGKERYALRIRLRSGVDGKIVKRITLRLKSPRLGARVKAQLEGKLVPAVDGLPFVEEQSAARPGASRSEQAREQGKPTGVADREALTPEDTISEEGPRATSAVLGPSASMAGSLAPASLQLGASVVARDLTFSTDPPDFAEAPDGYDGPLAPGIYASGEVYPLAFTSMRTSPVAKLGVGFEIDRVIGLKTAIQGGAMETPVPTTQMRYGIGLRVRHRFGQSAMRPTIKLAFGMGRLSFVLDEDAVPIGVVLDVPSTSYAYMDPGIGVHVPITPRVALTTAGHFMLVTDTGEMQKPDQYGAAKLLAFSADAGVEVMATERLLVRLAAAYTAVSFEFKGTGAQTNNRDGDETTKDVTGALDRYLHGMLAVGYRF